MVKFLSFFFLRAMHVHDSMSYAKIIDQLNTARKVLEQSQQSTSQLQSLNQIVGLNQRGDLSPFLSLIQEDGNLFKDFQTTYIKSSYMEGKSFGTSYGDSRAFYGKAFFPKRGAMTTEVQQDYLTQRQHALKEATVHAMSLAVHQKQTLKKHHERLMALSQRASQTTNLHEDMRTMNQFLSVLATELNGLRALSAASLELQAAESLKNQPVVFQP